MNATNWPKFLGLVVISLSVFMQYQNCAPARQTTTQNQTVSDDDNLVHIMGSVSFSVPEVHMAAAGPASVSGACDTASSDGSLNWELRDSDTGQTLAAGMMACANDQFNDDIPSMPALTCQKPYQLHVQSGFEGAEDHSVNLVRDCQ